MDIKITARPSIRYDAKQYLLDLIANNHITVESMTQARSYNKIWNVIGGEDFCIPTKEYKISIDLFCVPKDPFFDNLSNKLKDSDAENK